MSTLEKLLAEDKAIKKAMGRLYRRKDKLSKRLQDHRDAVILVDGELYKVSSATHPEIEYVGELER